jgi:hypothetical protein
MALCLHPPQLIVHYLLTSLIKTSVCSLLTIVSAFFLPTVGESQSSKKPQKKEKEGTSISIEHVLPFQEVPSSLNPGAPFLVSFTLKGTQSFEAPMRLSVVRDGSVYETFIPKGSLTPSDIPIYSVTIPAPMRSLTYQASLLKRPSEGLNSNPSSNYTEVASSQRYGIERGCIPPLRLDPAEERDFRIPSNVAKVARALEREITLYEEAIKILEELSIQKSSSRPGGTSQ